MKTAVIFFVSLVMSGMIPAVAAPRPAIVQGPREWTLDVVYDQPVQISVRLPGNPQPRQFWYLILSLTNNSPSQDLPFYPACELTTDTFQLIPAGKDVQTAVFEKIKLKHQGRYPFLESLDFVDHRILQGRDNSRDIVIIWPDFDPAATQINLFIAGLSNETAVIEHPIQKDPNGQPLKIYLQKTLHLKYSIGADKALRSDAQLSFTGQDWVMR